MGTSRIILGEKAAKEIAQKAIDDLIYGGPFYGPSDITVHSGLAKLIGKD